MKTKYFLLYLVFGTYTLNAQNDVKLVRTESNGVHVYESTGNEKIDQAKLDTSNPQKQISDWNLEECENALYYIELKMESLIDNEIEGEKIQLYELKRLEILERKQVLIALEN